jgi:hypothetical protein
MSGMAERDEERSFAEQLLRDPDVAAWLDGDCDDDADVDENALHSRDI